MAYMDQERKNRMAPAVKAICKRFGVKATLAVIHHSTIALNISEGAIDFFGERAPDKWSGERLTERTHLQVNPNGVREAYTGRARDFLADVVAALNDGNHNRSDAMTDYFDVGWYVDINVGKWNKPYVLTR